MDDETARRNAREPDAPGRPVSVAASAAALMVYLTAMKVTSGLPPFHSSVDGVTRLEKSVGYCSHSHGMAAAVRVTILSIRPQAAKRALGLTIRSARSIARLMLGSLRSGQFELFDDVMFLPLNVTSRTVCGSWKSGSQPTFGQMFGSLFGTLQNRVYIVACVTEIVLTLKPILAMSAATTSAVFEPGGVLSATIVTCDPVYSPDL